MLHEVLKFESPNLFSLSFLTPTSQHQYSDEDPGADMSQVRGRKKPGLVHLAEEESGHSPGGEPGSSRGTVGTSHPHPSGSRAESAGWGGGPHGLGGAGRRQPEAVLFWAFSGAGGPDGA